MALSREGRLVQADLLVVLLALHERGDVQDAVLVEEDRLASVEPSAGAPFWGPRGETTSSVDSSLFLAATCRS